MERGLGAACGDDAVTISSLLVLIRLVVSGGSIVAIGYWVLGTGYWPLVVSRGSKLREEKRWWLVVSFHSFKIFSCCWA